MLPRAGPRRPERPVRVLGRAHCVRGPGDRERPPGDAARLGRAVAERHGRRRTGTPRWRCSCWARPTRWCGGGSTRAIRPSIRRRVRGRPRPARPDPALGAALVWLSCWACSPCCGAAAGWGGWCPSRCRSSSARPRPPAAGPPCTAEPGPATGRPRCCAPTPCAGWRCGWGCPPRRPPPRWSPRGRRPGAGPATLLAVPGDDLARRAADPSTDVARDSTRLAGAPARPARPTGGSRPADRDPRQPVRSGDPRPDGGADPRRRRPPGRAARRAGRGGQGRRRPGRRRSPAW